MNASDYLQIAIFLILFIAKLNHHQAEWDCDLGGSQTNTRRFAHGLDHVIHQGLEFSVEIRDFVSFPAQTCIRQGDDGSEGHGFYSTRF